MGSSVSSSYIMNFTYPILSIDSDVAGLMFGCKLSTTSDQLVSVAWGLPWLVLTCHVSGAPPTSLHASAGKSMQLDAGGALLFSSAGAQHFL